MDPSTQILLRGQGSAQGTNQSEATPLDSGRYTVRPQPTRAPRPTQTEEQATAQESIEPQKSSQSEVIAEGQDTETANSKKTADEIADDEVTDDEMTEADMARSVGERVKDTLLGGNIETIEDYRRVLHPDDSRANVIEVSLSPGVYYLDSSSRYWFRKFNSFGPSLSASASFWWSPFMGVKTSYFTSLSGDIRAEATGDKRTEVEFRDLQVGLRFRNYFNLSRRSPYLVYGIDYIENEALVARSEAQRIGVKTTGFNLSLHAVFPTSLTHARRFGVGLMPSVKVQEQKTAVTVKSGNSPSSHAIKFVYGSDYSLNRNHQFFWRLSTRMQRTLYKGEASPNDPRTDESISGVSVTENLSLFEIGFTWGD